LLGTDALVTSAETGYGVDRLRSTIDKRIVELTSRTETADSGVALTVRHRQTVVEAIENVSESVNELKVGNDEVAAMMLRAAYYDLSNIQQQHIDEQILENIFRRFCIGK
jgi:tRNA U34 5-carboxymethylaminomethyl modifying GTPase MnmE/TrmE